MTALVAALAVALVVPSAPAHAEEPVDPRLQEFTSAVGVDASIESELEDAVQQLTPSEREEFLSTAAEDPLAVMELTAVSPADIDSTPIVDSGRPTAQVFATASNRRLNTANQSYKVSVLGIQTGTFSLRYRFESNGTAVTRNLECTAWWSGFSGFWSIASSATQWIAGGKGTCIGTHRMSIVAKGSMLTAVKEQGLSYNGKPTLLRNYIKNL